jgi:hypothetical protein
MATQSSAVIRSECRMALLNGRGKIIVARRARVVTCRGRIERETR